MIEKVNDRHWQQIIDLQRSIVCVVKRKKANYQDAPREMKMMLEFDLSVHGGVITP